MEKEKNKERIPQLRFPEFKNAPAWEQRKLGEVAERFDNLRIPVSAQERSSGTTPYYGANGIQDYIDGYTHDGEYILIAEDGANDLKDYPIQYVNGKVWVNNHAHVVQGISDFIDNKFLLFAMKQINVEPFLVGGGRAKLNADILMKLLLTFPSLPEQKAIGDFFSTLDRSIALHQRELENLKNRKKSLLQKMFPKNGESVPKIRFPEFKNAPAWEQRKLGEVSTHRCGTSIEKYFDSKGVYKVISIGSYGLDGEYIDQGIRASSNNITDKKTVKNNELTMVLNDKTTNGIIIGRTLLIRSDNEYVVNQRTEIISPNNNFDSQFAFTLLNSSFREQVKKIVQGGTQIYVNYSSVERLKFYIPSLSEQKAIGDFFSTLDRSIALHQRKLEHLKFRKKALLQKMFP
ncbi:restriction endonuclease subunit S [Streptococcus anginosus]|uniref:restriction endonuclease subunit S n=1 Tax=Streptococcus anginosus TaxID=1328 RepID=UPI0034A3E41F